MSIPLEPPCAGLLFSLAMQYGGLAAKASEPISTWDQNLVTFMLETLQKTPMACNRQITEDCLTELMEVDRGLENIRMEGDEALPDQTPELLDSIGQPLQEFISCMLAGYELSTMIVEERPVPPEELSEGDWPYFSEPQRRKRVR